MTRRGKMVFCVATSQVFPSARAASIACNISYANLTKRLEGKIKKGDRFVYIENMSELSDMFKKDIHERNKREEEMRRLREEIDRLESERLVARQEAKERTKAITEARKKLAKMM